MKWDLQQILHLLSRFWNFTLITVGSNPIRVGNMILGVIFVVAGFWAARRLSRILSHRLLRTIVGDLASRATVETLIFYLLATFLTIFALNMANIPLTVFTVIGGALAIGVGFGSQNVVNNFISGIILMLERPVKVGDFTEVEGLFGQVQEIGFRSTRILAFGNRHIIVPNSSFLEKNVINWTLVDPFVRTGLGVGVAYGSPVDHVRTLLLQAAHEEPLVLKDPEPQVYFTHFGDNALEFELYFTLELENLAAKKTAESNLRFRIDALFREAKISITFPQRDVHLDIAQPVRISLQGEKSH